MSVVDARSTRRRLVAGLLVVAGLSTGCAQLMLWDPDYLLPFKRKAIVRETAETYGQNLRWGKFEVAARMVAPESRDDFLATFLNAEPPYQFTSFEIISVDLGDERDRAGVHVVFKLYRPPMMIELSVSEHQAWRYEPSVPPRWVIEPQLRAFQRDASHVRAALD